MKIKIHYDNCIFVLQKIGGISIVFGEIIKRLKLDRNLSIELIMNGDADRNLIFNEVSSGITTINEIKINRKILAFFPLLKLLPAGSIYHSTYSRYSFQKNIKKVTTIHDFGYEKGIMRSGIKRYVHLFFKRITIKYADAIICVSENTKKDLEFFYAGILKNKVVKVIYNGLSEEYLLASQTHNILENENYILFVGARHGYKNFYKLLEGISELPDFKLFICGGGELTAEENNALNKYVPGRYNVFLNLTTSDLIHMYSNAFCLVYPSSYEGFGLPILEAMSCGCPVIACSNSSIPEICGDAAFLIPEAHSLQIKNGILRLTDNEFRNELITKGRINARKYTWKTTALLTLRLYEELVS